MLAVDRGVHHQIGQGPLDGVGAQGRRQRRIGVDLDAGAGAGGAFAHFLDQGADVHDLGRLAGFAAGEGEVLVDHVLHLGQVALHLLQPGARIRKGQLELQAGQRRAQIMADRGQQGRALGDVALDARLHVEEGDGGLAHLGGAVGPEAGLIGALAEGLGGGGQPLDGPHLVADEQHRHRGQEQGGARQPHHERARLGREGAVARRQHPQDTLRQLDPDIDIGRVAGRVEPERLVQPLRKRALHDPIQRREKRPATFRGQALALLQGDR